MSSRGPRRKSKSSNSSTQALTLLSTVHRGLKSCSSHFVIAIRTTPDVRNRKTECPRVPSHRGMSAMVCRPWYTMRKDRQPARKAPSPRDGAAKEMGDSNYLCSGWIKATQAKTKPELNGGVTKHETEPLPHQKVHAATGQAPEARSSHKPSGKARGLWYNIHIWHRVLPQLTTWNSPEWQT